MRGGQQAFDDFSILQMGLNNFIDVVLIDKGIPYTFWIDDGNRTGSTSVQATGLVDPNLSRTSQSCRLDQRLATIKSRLGTVLGATFFAILAFIEAEKDVMLVVSGVLLILAGQRQRVIACDWSHGG